MKKEKLICCRCDNECKEQIYAEPTYFSKFLGDVLVESICIDCWNKGEKWDNSSSKNAKK